MHGGSAQVLDAIQANHLHSPELNYAEQSLLEFARKVNLDSSEIRRADIELLMQSGWSELQIAEAVHVAALFSTFNRVANAFGLKSQGLLALYECGAEGASIGGAGIERTDS
jgi:alkylhydroperoxidase family enzyme